MQNKNYKKMLQKPPQPHRKLSHMQQNVKVSSHLHMQTVHNSTQEAELVSNLIWRQQTAMPIIKVARYRMQMNDFGYPKIYRIEIEPLVGSLQRINKIQLTDALYLIKNCLLGIQALTYKYNNFDFTQTFFAINAHGQCKAWITNNLFQFKPSMTALPSQFIIVLNIIKMVYNHCTSQAQLQLNRLIEEVAKNQNLNYTQMNLRLSQFAQLKRIQIPLRLKIQELDKFLPSGQQNNGRRDQTGGSKGSTPCKVNFRYYSPLPRDCGIKPSKSNQKVIASQIFNANPQNVNWNYQQCQSYRQISKSKTINTQDKTSSQRQNSSIQKKKAVQSMLKSSQILKNKLKQSKNQLRESFILEQANQRQKRNQIMYESIQISQNDHINTHFYSQKALMKQNSNISSNTKNTSDSASSYISERNNNHVQNAQFIERYPQQISKVFNQVYYSNNNNKGKNLNNQNVHISPYHSHYDFGGLLPLHQRPTLQSQIVEQGESFNQSEHNICSKLPHGNIDLTQPCPKQQIKQLKQMKIFHSKQQGKTTTYHSQKNSPNKLAKDLEKVPQNKTHVSTILNTNINDNFLNARKQKWGWANKVVRLLSEEDDPDMKESFHYGQQIKQQPLNIQLQKLGKMGRQISSTFIPEANQYS